MGKREYCCTLTIKSDSEGKFTLSLDFNPGLKGDETDLPIRNAYFLGVALSHIAALSANRDFERELDALIVRYTEHEEKESQQETKIVQEASRE